jgi:putative effector of murein hydrolase
MCCSGRRWSRWPGRGGCGAPKCATAHGIGATRALQVHPDAGACAGIALGLQMLLASLLMPLLFRWFG